MARPTQSGLTVSFCSTVRYLCADNCDFLLAPVRGQRKQVFYLLMVTWTSDGDVVYSSRVPAF